jgi:hydroxysqualene synthase
VVTAEVRDAYATCQRLARAHYENFPVASWLLPRELRPHVAAIYAFARSADDFADEPGYSQPERLRLLDGWEDELLAPTSTNPIFLALHATIRTFELPIDLFTDLLSAFRQDVTTTRYETWDEVFDYCRRSANPVGRLVLRLAGVRDPATDRASDALCTALQLTNFWQDLAIDWRRGRLYVPAEEHARAGASFADLDAGRMTPPWRHALAGSVARTSALFDEGREVCDAVGGRLRLELRATWHGGRRILDRLASTDVDVFTHRPTLGVRDVVMIGWRTVFWPRSR